jgi:cytosine/adenosine deaminase-related metal-dependent hydrolase
MHDLLPMWRRVAWPIIARLLSDKELICMKAFWSARVTLSALFCLCFAQDLAADPATWVLGNVNVIAMDGEAIHHAQDLFIAGNRIAAMQATGSTPLKDKVVIDGNGGYVIPGLTDMHVHLGSPLMLALWLEHGVTSLRVMSSQPHVVELRAAVDRGEVFGPRLFLASPLFEGEPPLWPESNPVTDADQARRLVREYAAQGHEAVKIYDGLTEEVLAAIIAEAAATGLPVVGHMPDQVPLDALLSLHPASLEHVGGLLPAWFRAERDDCELPRAELEQLGVQLAEAGVTLVPTLSLYQMLGDVDARDAVRSEAVFDLLPAGLTEHFWGNVTPEPGSDRARRSVCRLANARTLISAYISAGGHPLPGTDTPNPWLVPGLALHQELALLVESGLSPEQALFSATRAAAEWFGLGEERGTVSVGKIADLVLLDANPLEDITHTRRVAGVVLDGQWWSKDALQNVSRTIASQPPEGQ